MDASSQLDLDQLMEDVPVRDILSAMCDRALWYACRPGVLPGHLTYWTDCANVLSIAVNLIKEET
jgi:hypothetical protein